MQYLTVCLTPINIELQAVGVIWVVETWIKSMIAAMMGEIPLVQTFPFASLTH